MFTCAIASSLSSLVAPGVALILLITSVAFSLTAVLAFDFTFVAG
ncbi:hypothetical protein ACUXOR_001421 [Staphylococcus pasteuri]|nr:hypothetical protein [Staphylococcus pasteuri]